MKYYKLVQSGMFPNIWSLVSITDSQDSHTWRDPMFANGAMAADNAVEWARVNGHYIVEVSMVEGDIHDPRNGRLVDPASEVIAGIEYRTKRSVIERVSDGG